METRIEELQKQRIQEIGREYQTKGYDITVYPKQTQLPDFLAEFQPHIIARRDDETVIIEVKSRASLAKSPYLRELARAIEDHSGWRFELVIANPKADMPAVENTHSLGMEDIENKIETAKTLLEAHPPEAALMLAWSATEATLRLLASREDISLRRTDSPYLLKQLATYAVISRDEYHFLVKAMKLRNAVAHGFKAENFESAFVQKLLDIITYLLQTPPDA
jgi:hypothetical protein